MQPIYIYDTIQPFTDWVPSYGGPLVESECSGTLLAKAADATTIFGHGTSLSIGGDGTPIDFSFTSLSDLVNLTDNVIFKSVVIALFIYYCVTVFHFRDCIATLFKVAKIRSDESTLLDDSTYIFSFFLRTATAIWFIMCGVAFVKFADMTLAYQLSSNLPQWAIHLLIVPATAIMPIVMLYQKAMIGLIAKTTLSNQFTHLLIYIKTLYTALAVIVMVPSVILLALYNGDLQDILLYVIAAETVVIICFWLYKSYMLFIKQNVSILHWILYLCAIEIFPFTLLILISLRLT